MIKGPNALTPPLGRLGTDNKSITKVYNSIMNIRAEEKQHDPHVSLRVCRSIPDLLPFPDFVLGALNESVKAVRSN